MSMVYAVMQMAECVWVCRLSNFLLRDLDYLSQFLPAPSWICPQALIINWDIMQRQMHTTDMPHGYTQAWQTPALRRTDRSSLLLVFLLIEETVPETTYLACGTPYLVLMSHGTVVDAFP